MKNVRQEKTLRINLVGSDRHGRQDHVFQQAEKILKRPTRRRRRVHHAAKGENLQKCGKDQDQENAIEPTGCRTHRCQGDDDLIHHTPIAPGKIQSKKKFHKEQDKANSSKKDQGGWQPFKDDQPHLP